MAKAAMIRREPIVSALAVVALGFFACSRAGPDGSPTPVQGAAQPSSAESPVVTGGRLIDAAKKDEGGPAETAASAESTPPERPAPSPADAGNCPKRADPSLGVLVSPRRPMVGQPVRVMAATLNEETPLAIRLEVPQGTEGSQDHPDPVVRHRWGVPSAVIAQWTASTPGVIKAVIGRNGEGLACVQVRIRRGGKTEPPERDGNVWRVDSRWDRAEEALYSAWIRELFTVPRGEELAFRSLDEVTSRPERNVLHGHFGWGEDRAKVDGGLYLRPDCADFPYFLRAYYAWKRRLPHGFRKCSRGGNGRAPRCGSLLAVPGLSVEVPPGSTHSGELAEVQRYLRRDLAWGVHTGNGRTALDDDDTDLYPVALTRSALRPGTVYADPYGHILVVVELMTHHGSLPGVLYAVDGQPDGSITRKRFWEGNFLWNPDPGLGGSGFKAFRPVVVEDDGVRALTNAELTANKHYGDVSQEQGDLSPAEFYDRMEALITPGTRDPFVAQEQAVTALAEAAVVRVTSVNNGQDFLRTHPGAVIEMPDGHAIFETTGNWENYSTPARDLRLLIALDVVSRFEEKVARNPKAYGVDPGPALEQMQAALREQRRRLLRDSKYAFEYRRSDGTLQSLTLEQLVTRAKAFEMAYNPNDCAEIRWGAAENSQEMATCAHRAPAPQKLKMKAYRRWFEERRRPARGDAGPPLE